MSRENKLGGAGELNGRKSRFATSSVIALAVGLVAFAGMAQRPAHAADDQQLQLLEDQIRQLQAQIDGLKKAQATQAAAAPAIPAGTKPAYGYETGSHQFGWVSADGQNSIELTGRLHFDVADYAGYTRKGGTQAPSNLDGGLNARRARLGITGKFMGDFSYAFIGDFGGTSDTIAAANTGAPASEIENAFITYNGFNKPGYTVPLAFDIGYIDVPVFLNEATSSNDRLMLEAPTAEVLATAFGGGDARSAAGVRSYKTNYWAAVYMTGPAAGASHSYPATGQSQPIALLGRATYNPIQDDVESLHVGANIGHVVNTGAASADGNHSFTLSDRPELRVDPTATFGTITTGNAVGAINNVKGADVYGAELAGAYQNFFAQGEYYIYQIDRQGVLPTNAAVTAKDLSFSGGYAEASYSIGGKRKYNPSTGSYTGVIVEHPLSLKDGSGWGAIEFAARYSEVNLNSG
jgi:phosphate-selective porin OprO/OprP